MPLPVDVDLRLRAEGLKARQIELGALNARLQSDRQQATVTIDELQAYGGRLAGYGQGQARQPAGLRLDLQSPGHPTARRLAGAERPGAVRRPGGDPPGPRHAGSNQRQLVQALGGDGKLVLRDGAVLGVNIAGHAAPDHDAGPEPRRHPAAADRLRRGRRQLQDPRRASSATSDLFLRAPVLRLDGAGCIDLPQRTVDYRITPQLATTLEGQGASGTPALQAGIPFLVQGPFAAPFVRFDLNGTLTERGQLARRSGARRRRPRQEPAGGAAARDQFDLLDQLPAPAAGKARDLLEGVLGGGCGAEGGLSPRTRPTSATPRAGCSRASAASMRGTPGWT